MVKVRLFAIGMTWEEAHRRCPDGVVPACHNSHDTVTISGPAEAVSKFVAELQSEGIFAKEVQSAGVAFHSYCMSLTADALKARLLEVCAVGFQFLLPGAILLSSINKCQAENFITAELCLQLHYSAITE